MDRTVGIVGAHLDDIELACGGTIQYLARRDYKVIGLAVTVDPLRVEAAREASQMLGYELILGDITEEDLDRPEVVDKRTTTPEKMVRDLVYDKLIRQYDPFIVFTHSPKDRHHHHRWVSIGTRSGARKVKNLLEYTGPLEDSFSPVVFFTFGEEEMRKKLEACRRMERAYGKTRYFTEEYIKGWAQRLGQRLFFYDQRAEAPYLVTSPETGEKTIPYAEGFEVVMLRDPF